MSMFRRPGDSSSSEDESSNSREETSAPAEDHSVLSRINTLDSAQSSAQTGRHSGLRVGTTPPTLTRNNTSEHIRDLVLHSLLEDKATKDAAEHLGRDPSDPEVQQLAKATYQSLVRQFSTSIDETYASDAMRQQRATAQEGINRATHHHLTGLTAAVTAPASAAASGASQALVPRPITGISYDSPRAASSTIEKFLGLQNPVPLFLQGHPGLHTDRYVREYEEVEVVGKGGYGKVYKVKHKLDNSFYAVKRIMVSASKMQKIQDCGAQEMESLLEEVRSLARFDHGNVVRYHSAWLEFSTRPAETTLPAKNFIRSERLLPDALVPSFSNSSISQMQASFDSLGIDDPFHVSHGYSGGDIVFEANDTSAGAEESRNEAEHASLMEKVPRRSNRRGSQATIATISSAHSRIGAVEDVLEEDEDIEMIPRTHQPVFEESESMMSNSDMPHQLVTTRATGPVLTLNVQMSLYDSNLAAFLSTEHCQPTHCFHPCISLELLNSILSGVEYLHSQGVVHRDLKPANVFLSVSTGRLQPAGSVDLSSCHSCPERECLRITPRIGDFGLVAALGDGDLQLDAAAKPVGTEFYRPTTCSKINEKLDIFALGVVTFEMLRSFGTRMERIDALTKLRRGVFPEGFASRFGDVGEKVLGMIGGMVDANEEERWGCEDVKREVGKLVGGFKA